MRLATFKRSIHTQWAKTISRWGSVVFLENIKSCTYGIELSFCVMCSQHRNLNYFLPFCMIYELLMNKTIVLNFGIGEKNNRFTIH